MKLKFHLISHSFSFKGPVICSLIYTTHVVLGEENTIHLYSSVLFDVF